MIWLLLSGYFVIAAVFYHSVGPQALEDVIKSSSDEELSDIKKYGPSLMAFYCLFWPVAVVLGILMVVMILLKR